MSSLLTRVIRGDVTLLPVTRDRGLADRIVSSVWVDRAALSKETAAGRFRDLDDMLIDLIRQVPNPVIHDVAVSNGITSLELLDRLRAAGIPARLYISDKFARCVSVRRGLVARVYDAYGSLLHARVGVVLADRQASWRFPVSRVLFRLLGERAPSVTDADVTEIVLYDRWVRDALDAGVMTNLEYDVFSSRVDIEFDFVRCMNTITRKNFSPERIAAAVANLQRSIKPSGLLLVGRTVPGGRNDATFFRLEGGCFVPERVVNQGTDIHDIVVACAKFSRVPVER
jgi:hypothetical protein